MFDSLLDIDPAIISQAIRPDGLMFFIKLAFWAIIFIIALNETSIKNRRGK